MELERAKAQSEVRDIKRLLQAACRPVVADALFRERLLKRLRKEIGR